MSQPPASEHRFFQLQLYDCPICGETRSETLMRKAGRLSPEPFSIVRCTSCLHVRVNPRIADDALGELYDEAYYRGEGFDASVDYSGSVSTWTRAENARIIETVVEARRRPITRTRWLDFGCGTGTLVEAVVAAGAIGIGTDDSDAAIAACREREIDVVSIADLESQLGTFDVVSAIEVIEHVPDPISFVRHLKRFLKPGGIIYVHTENWNVVRRLPGTPYLMPEGHIQYFSPRVMRMVFGRSGLNEVDAFDRCWFVWRRLPAPVKRLIPAAWLRASRAVLVRNFPEYAPFPVAEA